MKTRAICSAVSAAAVLAGATAATPTLAADVGVKVPAAAVPAAPLPPFFPPYLEAWSGMYVGVEGGYGWGRQTFDAGSFPGLNLDSIPTNGALFGGFAGAQKQFGSWVLGIEADFDGASLRGFTSFALPNGPNGAPPPSIPGQLAPVTGTALLAPTTVAIPGQPITATGTTLIPDLTGPVFSTVPLFSVTSGEFAGPIRIGGVNGTPTGMMTQFGTATVMGMPVQVTVTNGTAATAAAVPGQVAQVTGSAVVAGQEFVQLSNINPITTVSVNTRIDELASVRGKFGFTPSPSWMVYTTGGLALAHVQNTVTATESFVADLGNGGGLQSISATTSSSGGATLLGWALGAGIDWKWTGTNWVLGAEYLHYDFPKNTIGLSDSSASVNLINARQSVDAVKGRISYLFPIH